MRGDRDHELIGLYFRLVTEHRHETFQPSMMPGGLSMPYLLNRFFGRDTEAPPPRWYQTQENFWRSTYPFLLLDKLDWSLFYHMSRNGLYSGGPVYVAQVGNIQDIRVQYVPG